MPELLPSGVHRLELASTLLELVNERFVCVLLQIIDQEHDVDPSFLGLNEFLQGHIGGEGIVHGVGDNPDVLLAGVNYLPNVLEILITIQQVFSGRPKNGLKVQFLNLF